MQSRLYGSTKPGYTALESKPEAWATPVRPTGQLAGVKNMWYNLSYEPLTEGRTHTCLLSYWEHRASCKAAFFVSRRKLPDREYFSLHSVKVATPLAPFMRLFPVDLPSVDGFENRPPPASFEKLLWREL